MGFLSIYFHPCNQSSFLHERSSLLQLRIQVRRSEVTVAEFDAYHLPGGVNNVIEGSPSGMSDGLAVGSCLVKWKHSGVCTLLIGLEREGGLELFSFLQNKELSSVQCDIGK